MARKAKDADEPKIGVIYARYSSANQREESIEQQIAECKNFAETNGITITEIYADAAQTGRNEKRTAYQKLLRDAKKGSFRYILAYKSSRIARNMFNALQFENEMERRGIEVLYAKEEFGNNAAGRFALRTMMNVNQFYSENMGEDVKRALDDNARQCKMNSIPPYGYRKAEDGRFALDEDTAPIAREIFERVATGEEYASIFRDLNHRGIRTRQGKEWQRTSFAGILSNERYTGVYLYGDVRIENGMPAIISRELFDEVQRVMKEKGKVRGRHSSNSDYLLTGRIYCGYCGEHMMGVSGTSHDGTTYYYYACASQWNKRGCTKKAVRRDWIESQTAAVVKENIMTDEMIRWITDQVMDYQKRSEDQSERKLLEEQLKSTEQSIGNIVKAIEMGIITESTKARLDELETSKANLKHQLAVLKSQEITVTREQVAAWLEAFKDGDISSQEYRSELFKSFMKAVYVFDDKLRIVFDIDDSTDRSVDFILGDNTEQVLADSDIPRENGAIRTNRADVRVRGTIVVLTYWLQCEKSD